MKVVAALAALLALGAAPVETRPVYSGHPPLRYMGDNVAVVIFTRDMDTACGTRPGYIVLGCHNRTKSGASVIALPNPCLFPGEIFARLSCHELGHANGWAGDHPY